MPTTITVREETKELLKSLKGDRDWDSFLRELASFYLSSRREEVRRKLSELLVEEKPEDLRVRKWSREYL